MLLYRLGLMTGWLALAGLLLLGAPASAQSDVKSATMDAVKKRGQLICGIDTGIPGYAFQDSKGDWQGLDVAYCRAIADAVLGSPDKVKYIGTTSKVRFSVLQSGEIDVLIRDSEFTFIRNTQLGLDEPAVNFFTAQTFMVKKSLGVAHTKDLNGATICLLTGTTLETNIADYNRANNIITYRDIERASVDYYSTLRTYYLQRRARLIEDRSVPTQQLPDF